MHMANVYVYHAVVIAAGVLPNRQMRAENYDHIPCFMEDKSKR